MLSHCFSRLAEDDDLDASVPSVGAMRRGSGRARRAREGVVGWYLDPTSPYQPPVGSDSTWNRPGIAVKSTQKQHRFGVESIQNRYIINPESSPIDPDLGKILGRFQGDSGAIPGRFQVGAGRVQVPPCHILPDPLRIAPTGVT